MSYAIVILSFIIFILAICCIAQYFKIIQQEIDADENSKDYTKSRDNAYWLGLIARRRGKMLKDISEALPNDLRNLRTQEYYYLLWMNIQEDIQKELKAKA